MEEVSTNIPFFQNEIESLSTTQVNVLKAVAENETQLTSEMVMIKYEHGIPNNVSKNKKLLIEKDLIVETDSGSEFADPVFELWFRKQFFNTQYFK